MDLDECIWYNNFNGGIIVDFDNKIIRNYFDCDNYMSISVDNSISQIRNNHGEYIEISGNEKTISKSYADRWGEEHPMNLNDQDFDLIVGLINNSIAKLNDELRYLQDRLSQTTDVNIKIVGGYKISKPPSHKLKLEYNDKITKIKLYLEFLESINIDKHIKS